MSHYPDWWCRVMATRNRMSTLKWDRWGTPCFREESHSWKSKHMHVLCVSWLCRKPVSWNWNRLEKTHTWWISHCYMSVVHCRMELTVESVGWKLAADPTIASQLWTLWYSNTFCHLLRSVGINQKQANCASSFSYQPSRFTHPANQE